MEEIFRNLPALEPGTVWLAGAGPGDPGLLSVLALHGLRQAEVIVYDALVDNRILDLAQPGVMLEYAGKGGDPFVFGRGGEEALALVAAGIAFRIVPGISAGIGGLAYAGIPVTHREVGSAATFVTGHDSSGTVPAIDWEAIARGSPVIILYMSLKHLDRIAERLIAGGRSPSETVAIVSKAT